MVSEIPKECSVMGLPVHILKDYASWLLGRFQQGLGCHVITLNSEMTMQALENSALASLIHQAELVIPDGSGVVLYLRLEGERVERVPGIELAQTLLQEAANAGTSRSVFFYGGAPGIAQQAAQRWQQQIPGLAIAGVAHGYLSTDEQQQLSNTLQKLQPSLIFVGLGVPRQEFWIHQHRHLCPQAIWVGVGGSFDVWAGYKSRAPAWLRDHHLEWAYRLYQEPHRWRRMLALPHFAWRSLLWQVGLGRSAVRQEN